MRALIILLFAFFMGLPIFALTWIACALGAIFGTVLLPLGAIVAKRYGSEAAFDESEYKRGLFTAEGGQYDDID